MNRRKFLGSAPIAGAALVGMSTLKGPRLYGEPASLQTTAQADAVADALLPSLFRIHSTIAGGASAYTPSRLAACRMAISFVKDAKAAQSFLNSPTEFMEQHGIASGSVDTSSPEYAVISALANPEVRNAALTSDPVAFLQAMPEVNSPTLPVIDTVVVGTVYVHLAAVATLSLAAVAVVVVAVVVLVAGAASREAPLQDNTVVSVAGALGGSNFAKDVAGEQARASIAKLVAAIQDGQVKLPDGITPIQAISVLKHSLKKHMIVA